MLTDPRSSLAPVARRTAHHGAPRNRSTVDRWLADTGIDSGTTSRTKPGTRGSGTRTVAVVSTSPSGRRHGEESQARRNRPWSSNAWSRKAMRAAAPAREDGLVLRRGGDEGAPRLPGCLAHGERPGLEARHRHHEVDERDEHQHGEDDELDDGRSRLVARHASRREPPAGEATPAGTPGQRTPPTRADTEPPSSSGPLTAPPRRLDRRRRAGRPARAAR